MLTSIGIERSMDSFCTHLTLINVYKYLYRKASNANGQLVYRLKYDMLSSPFNKTHSELGMTEQHKTKPISMTSLRSDQRQMKDARAKQEMFRQGQTSDKFVEDSLLMGDTDLIIVYHSK